MKEEEEEEKKISSLTQDTHAHVCNNDRISRE